LGVGLRDHAGAFVGDDHRVSCLDEEHSVPGFRRSSLFLSGLDVGDVSYVCADADLARAEAYGELPHFVCAVADALLAQYGGAAVGGFEV